MYDDCMTGGRASEGYELGREAERSSQAQAQAIAAFAARMRGVRQVDVSAVLAQNQALQQENQAVRQQNQELWDQNRWVWQQNQALLQHIQSLEAAAEGNRQAQAKLEWWATYARQHIQGLENSLERYEPPIPF